MDPQTRELIDTRRQTAVQDLPGSPHTQKQIEKKTRHGIKQGREGVPLQKAFLFEINKAKDNKRKKCSTKESVYHFLSKFNKHTTK
jgi:hypothetical protein